MKKIKAIILVIFLGFFIYQTYYYIKHNANTIIVIGNQDKNIDENIVMLIDDKKVGEFRLRNHFSKIDKTYLSFGKNKITLKRSNSKNIFESTIYFYGVFSWNYIEFNQGVFHHEKYFTPPNW